MSEYRYVSDLPTWSGPYLWRPLVALLKRHAPPPQRVFEIGCGNGATARMLAEHGYVVTGVDPSTSGIAIAKRYESERLRFELGSTADDLAARFDMFPVVISLEVIEHCPSACAFAESFRSVLQVGGVGFISTPYHGYLKNLAVVAAGRFDHHFNPLWENGHLKFFSIPKLRQLLHDAGLLPLAFTRIGRIPPLAKSVIAVVRR